MLKLILFFMTIFGTVTALAMVIVAFSCCVVSAKCDRIMEENDNDYDF